MDRIIMWIMALCALAGGIDRMIGNRFGLGEKFEKGFMLLGPTALSMAGILCLVPLISHALGFIGRNLFAPLGLDSSVLAGILAIDMGGYQLAGELASTAGLAAFSGVIVSATLGCTVSFTIPVGMGMLNGAARRDFARGILFGLIALPVSLLTGGFFCGLGFWETIFQSMPLLLLALLVLIGIWRRTDLTIRIFSVFARIITVLTTIGLALGAFQYMTGFTLIPALAPIEDAMTVVASIGIVLLGSLPASELLMRALNRPLRALSRLTGMNTASVTALLIGAVSVLPAIAAVSDMDKRGRIVNAAALVCSSSCFAAHLGFVAAVDAGLLTALIVSKLAGGTAGALIALYATRGMRTQVE